jgi:integrase/recombinase XerD
MEDVRAYQLQYSWSHVNQVACALPFFYGITLGQKDAFERIMTSKDPNRLPPTPRRDTS